MNQRFSLKRRDGWFWSTDHTRAAIEQKLAAGEIDGEWLICPMGEAGRAVTVREFLANPSILGPAQPETAEAPNVSTPDAPTVSATNVRSLLPLITAALCIVIALANAGWFIILLGLPYLIVCAGHVFVHWAASDRPRRSSALPMASNATLLLTFLLLPDTGDSSGWIAYKVVLFGALKGSSEAQPPWWLPSWSFLLVFLAYLVMTAWWLFTGQARRPDPSENPVS